MSGSMYIGVNNQARKIKNIYVGVNGVARKVNNMYVGVNNIARQINISNIKTSKTMTVLIDLNNDDPNTWATYADDAVNMPIGSDAWDAFFGHYPCILENGEELGKLDRNDFSKYEDGTDAPITTLGKDVMICYPRRDISISKTNNIITVSMTDNIDDENFSHWAHSYKGNNCDAFYLGAYKAYRDNGQLYSISGQNPTGSESIGTFRSSAQARGIGYEQSAFFQLIYRQVMYLLKYKGQNSQETIGKGYTNAYSSFGATGYTNDKGMDWGETTGRYPMKLFGIEDFYGGIYEFIDGFYTDTNRRIYVADGNYNDNQSGYIDAGTAPFDSDISGYMITPNATELAGFTPASQTYGSENTYFCDYSNISSSHHGHVGGYNYNNPERNGVFCFMTSYGYIIVPNVGARLMYIKQSANNT